MTDDGAHQHAADAAMIFCQQNHRIRKDAPAKLPAIKARQTARGALKVITERFAPASFVSGSRGSIMMLRRRGEQGIGQQFSRTKGIVNALAGDRSEEQTSELQSRGL